LVSRGLTTTSARMPTIRKFEKKLWWRFVAVREHHAYEAARIMEQELKIRGVTNAE
jgi:hypothetical protein